MGQLGARAIRGVSKSAGCHTARVPPGNPNPPRILMGSFDLPAAPTIKKFAASTVNHTEDDAGGARFLTNRPPRPPAPQAVLAADTAPALVGLT